LEAHENFVGTFLKKLRSLSFAILLTSTVIADEIPPISNKQQVVYLAQVKDCKESLSLYKKYKEELGRHDFEVLQQVATLILEQSARNNTPEKQILGIFGCSIGGFSAPSNLLEKALTSSEIQVQLAAIQYLGRMQEDHSDILLNKAMSSPFLFTRIEAAFILAHRKAKSSTGQIESLMYRIPPQMRSFFPEFFAVIGTSEAIHILRHLMDDSFDITRIQAILSAARHGRDDLLPPIRAAVTHLNGPEQEACAAALGYLKDMKSIKKLKKLANTGSSSTKLAALFSLHLLGDERAAGKIAYEAEQKNIFAIAQLANIEGYENTLLPLLFDKDIQVRFNVALSLLRKKDARSIPILLEFLIRTTRDLGVQPQHSMGGALRAWKVVSSSTQRSEDSFYDINALSLALKEMIITESLELPEGEFLNLADRLFMAKQHELIPKLVSLLETLKTPGAIALLKEKSMIAGAPLIRTYCNLALLRLKEPGPYKEIITEFVKESRSHELIRFRSTLPASLRLVDTVFTLTPEENSALLIRSYETLAREQPDLAINLLIDAIELGNPQNRPVLAGILLNTLL
jgi:HEAT repeat protein